MRLDLYLKENFNIQSRNKAHELIKNNKIKVNGKIVSKPSYSVEPSDDIMVLEDNFYVSRAAYKLKYFLDEIDLDLSNLDALDIGSSTGGFTQILLQNGIKTVTCVDVGSNQLHQRIKNDPRIIMFENTDIRDFKSDKTFDIITCDVSFISIHNILDHINKLASDHIIILYKPQFEVGKEAKRDSKGVVKDQKAINRSRQYFLDTIKFKNWNLIYNSLSKLEGKEGNNEELFYFEVFK